MILLIFFCLVSLRAQTTYDTYRATATKGSFCNVIGGACAADPDFDGGFFQNPAALAVGGPDFNFDFDFDFDTARRPDREPGAVGIDRTGTLEQMGALAFAFDHVGLGISYAGRETRTRAAYAGAFAETSVREDNLNLPFAFRLNSRWQLGLSLEALWMRISTAAPAIKRFGGSASPTPALAVVLGVIHQFDAANSAGIWLRLPSSTRSEETADALTLSRHLVQPLILALGGRHERARFGGLAQLDLVGTTPGGAIFSNDDLALQNLGLPAPAKGRALVVQPHVGSRWEFIEAWTGFAGSYLETARTAGADSRVHLTLGLSRKMRLGLNWWDVAEVMGGVDVARDYQKWIFTFR